MAVDVQDIWDFLLNSEEASKRLLEVMGRNPRFLGLRERKKCTHRPFPGWDSRYTHTRHGIHGRPQPGDTRTNRDGTKSEPFHGRPKPGDTRTDRNGTRSEPFRHFRMKARSDGAKSDKVKARSRSDKATQTSSRWFYMSSGDGNRVGTVGSRSHPKTDRHSAGRHNRAATGRVGKGGSDTPRLHKHANCLSVFDKVVVRLSKNHPFYKAAERKLAKGK